MFQWNITDYDNLINYISTRHLLVNGEGLVITELGHIYRRLPSVLRLNEYIPSVQNRKKVNPPPVDDSNSTLQEKLDKERSDKQILAKRVADLEVENKTLETDVTKFKADLATRTKEIADLQAENKTCKCNVTKKLEAELATKTKEIADLEVENKTLKTDVTKLKADLATRTKEIADLQAENKTCKCNVTVTKKLEAELATKTKEIAGLEAVNKTLETDVTKLEADLATKTKEITHLEAENKTLQTDVTKLKADLAASRTSNEFADLEAANKTLETDVIKLKADLAARTNETADLVSKIKILEGNVAKLTPMLKEVWMNNFTSSIWVDIEKLNMVRGEVSFRVIQKKGCFTNLDINPIAAKITNVSSRYWFDMMIGSGPTVTAAIEIDDLLPNKEKARFSNTWYRFQSKGKTYVFQANSGRTI